MNRLEVLLTTAVAFVTLLAATTEAQTRIVPGTTVTNTVQSDWTEFHKQNMMRWNGVEKTLGVTNVKNLVVKWKYGATVESLSTPVMSNGVVYIGSSANQVYALDAASGTLLWNFATFGGNDASPAVANGVLYVGSTDNHVYALNATTGALLWSFTTGEEVNSAPVVANDVVYIASSDGYLYALDANTGVALWSYFAGGIGSNAFDSNSPAVFDNVVYIGTTDNKVYALNAQTGVLIWTYTAGAGIVASPAVLNGVVYIGSEDGMLHALNANTGVQLWGNAFGSHPSSPAIANGIVYFGAFGTEYAVNASSGKLLWSLATCSTCLGVRGEGSPAVANGVLYSAASSPQTALVYARNATTGAKLWSYPISEVPNVIVANGKVYALSGGQLYAFGLKSK